MEKAIRLLCLLGLSIGVHGADWGYTEADGNAYLWDYKGVIIFCFDRMKLVGRQKERVSVCN